MVQLSVNSISWLVVGSTIPLLYRGSWTTDGPIPCIEITIRDYDGCVQIPLPFPPFTVEADDDAGGLSVGGPHALRADVPLGGAQVGAGGDGRAHGAAAEAPHQHHRADGRGRGRHAETGDG